MIKKINKWHFLLTGLVILNLMFGYFSASNYGESVDELPQYSYAERTISEFKSFFENRAIPAVMFDEEPGQGSHGPAFIIIVSLLRKLFVGDGTPIEKLNFGHFIYFLVFQIGIISIYFLARRWLTEFAAFGTALLFSTQPLLYGHSLMNPKDVVFMSFFTASAVIGYRMLDRSPTPLHHSENVFKYILRCFGNELLHIDVWLAALILGFSSAIRLSAPLIGILFLTLIISSKKWTLIPRLFIYALLSVFFMIFFWPYLWSDPIGRFVESLSSSANFPGIHLTLFKGVVFSAADIPYSYLPTLLFLQLTETTLALMAFGVWSLIKKKHQDFGLLFLIWFFIPVLVIIFSHINLYNNFRQVFFILPPLFILAGCGLDWLFSKLKKPKLKWLILVITLLPALYANYSLFPYQYVYYNQFTGGLRGAFRLYELDYWNMAFREAQLYLNAAAPKNANIFVKESKYIAQTFARSDLIFNAYGAKELKQYDYIMVSTAQNADLRFANFHTVFVVQRDGVPLAFIKRPVNK